MWWEWLELEVRCEFAPFTRAESEPIQRVVERAFACGLDPERRGVRLPWSRLPDSARAARAAYVVGRQSAWSTPNDRS